MTAKSRRRKLERRERAALEQVNTYRFTSPNRIVELVAPDLETAQAAFMERFGYHPGEPLQENK